MLVLNPKSSNTLMWNTNNNSNNVIVMRSKKTWVAGLTKKFFVTIFPDSIKKSPKNKKKPVFVRSTYACLVVVDEAVAPGPAEELDGPLSDLVLDPAGHGDGPSPAGDDDVRQTEPLRHRRADRRRKRASSRRCGSHRRYWFESRLIVVAEGT